MDQGPGYHSHSPRWKRIAHVGSHSPQSQGNPSKRYLSRKKIRVILDILPAGSAEDLEPSMSPCVQPYLGYACLGLGTLDQIRKPVVLQTFFPCSLIMSL